MLANFPGGNYTACKAALKRYFSNIQLRVCSKPLTLTIKLLQIVKHANSIETFNISTFPH